MPSNSEMIFWIGFVFTLCFGRLIAEFFIWLWMRVFASRSADQPSETEPAKPQCSESETGRELAANYDAAVRHRGIPIVMQFQENYMVGVRIEKTRFTTLRSSKYARLLESGDRFFFCEPDSLSPPEESLRWCVCLHSYYYGDGDQRRYYLLYMPSSVESVAESNPTAATKES